MTREVCGIVDEGAFRGVTGRGGDRPAPPLRQELGALMVSLDRLEKEITLLTELLDPLLGPVGQPTVGDLAKEKNPVQRSEITGVVATAVHRVTSSAAVLDHLSNRLEL